RQIADKEQQQKTLQASWSVCIHLNFVRYGYIPKIVSLLILFCLLKSNGVSA
ncbi:hypothetical protein ACJX0J_020821, partial [Zea mays]